MRTEPPTPTEIEISRLGRFAVGDNCTEQDILCLMILFHTHQFEFRRPIFPDRPGVMGLEALTQRSAAAIAADAWPERNDKQRTRYVYWYFLFNAQGRGSFEVMEDVPQDLADKVLALKTRLLTHPDIASIEVED